MSRLVCAAFVALALAAAGCASLRARGDPAGPPLETPPPPPHSIPVVEIEAEPPPPPAGNDGPTPVVVRPSPRVAAPKHDKTSDKASDKTEAAPPAAVPAPPQANAPLPPLQTTANVTEVERNIRMRIAQATRDLDRTDYRALSTERRTEYDTAKRFIQQTEEALKVKNLVFAGQLADKAATLAAALVQK
jgi:hypothetical protein